ncbi:MAG: hypothetical protein JWN41_1531 [Thermoleophilia bacterium]|nr:hypothetical protein [Thermoleophilia bacterium]
MGALFALASSLSWGTSDLLGGRATERYGALRVLAFAQVATLVLLWGAVAVLRASGSLEIDSHRLLISALGGCAGVAGLAMFYTALAVGPMALVPPIAASGVGIPVLVGMLRGSMPGWLAFAGLALAVCGVTLAAAAPGAGEQTGGTRSNRVARMEGHTLLLALGAAVCFALIFLALDSATTGSATSALAATAGARLGSCVIVVLALLITKTNPFAEITAIRGVGLAGIGVLDAGANLGFALATVYGRLEVVAVLASLYPAVTSGLACLVLGERLGRWQLVGVSSALAGVVLLAH